MKVKVIGAGSIGNHLSHAARMKGWSVDLLDTDTEALRRTREEIYPQRYGKWDSEINLYNTKEAPERVYDIVFIGTPPDTHLKIARQQLAITKAIVIEKPLCAPDLQGLAELVLEVKQRGVKAFVGYNHLCGKALHYARQLLRSRVVSPITIDVEFREHWGGIFSAHPWLAGPKDSYLGFSDRGGGATGEHSHGINLWQHLALQTGHGRVVEVSANTTTVSESDVDYDQISFAHLKTESGLIGRLAQDVVTSPAQKKARIYCQAGSLEIDLAAGEGMESVSSMIDEIPYVEVFKKTRPDDFIAELDHLEDVLLSEGDKKYRESPLNIDRGVETMLVISAILKSARDRRTVVIDYASMTSAS